MDPLKHWEGRQWGARTETTTSPLPDPDEPCQVLYSHDGVAFRPETPTISMVDGWVHDDFGCLVVDGIA